MCQARSHPLGGPLWKREISGTAAALYGLCLRRIPWSVLWPSTAGPYYIDPLAETVQKPSRRLPGILDSCHWGTFSGNSGIVFFSDLFILQICPRRMIHWILMKVYNNTEKIIFVIPFKKFGVLFCFSGNVNLIYEKNIICHNSGLFFKAFCMGTFLPVFEGFELRIK